MISRKHPQWLLMNDWAVMHNRDITRALGYHESLAIQQFGHQIVEKSNEEDIKAFHVNTKFYLCFCIIIKQPTKSLMPGNPPYAMLHWLYHIVHLASFHKTFKYRMNYLSHLQTWDSMATPTLAIEFCKNTPELTYHDFILCKNVKLISEGNNIVVERVFKVKK